MILLLALILLSGIAVTNAGATAPPQTSTQGEPPCEEIVTDLVPGINAGISKAGLAHIEIRRCAENDGLQLVAWRASEGTPRIVLKLNRFSIGQVVIDKNVVALVFPGGYDLVLVLQYVKGEPKIVFSDSTHSSIRLAGDEKQVEVVIGDRTAGGKRARMFSVADDDLAFPPSAKSTGEAVVATPTGR